MIGALRVEHVERVSRVGEPIIAGREATGKSELHVVDVQGVGDDQVRLARHDGPVRQIVVVGVRVVEKAALLDHETPRVGTEPAGVPAERPGAGHARQALDRAPDVVTLDLLAHELVVDPLPAVAHDLVAGLDDRRRGLVVALERHRHREHADLDAVRGERAHEAPEADAASVFVHRLDLEVAHALERRQAHDFLQVGLGFPVPVQDRPLAAFLVVHDDLEGQARAAGPLRIRRLLPVSNQVTRIAHSEGGVAPHPQSEGASTAPSEGSPRSSCAGGAGARTRSSSRVAAHTLPMPVAPRLSPTSRAPNPAEA